MNAAHWERKDDGTIRCTLCPNDCTIAEGASGACRVRTNRGGVLEADSWGEVAALALDPIEKKPLYHFHPGSAILSVGPNGCNFRCGFCQNWGISQQQAATRHLPPEDLARLAGEGGSIGVAYTYAEPFVWYEYVRDAGALVHERGLANVLVTNGYVNEQPLRELLPLIDAMNIDIKSLDPGFYHKVCGGRLADVQRTVEIAAAACHVELTMLIIPGYNDTDADFERLAAYVAGIDPAIPLHLSRYYPSHTFDAPPTPPGTIARACEIARSRLRYVYAGNLDLPGCSDTRCPDCGAVLIARGRMTARPDGIEGGRCSSCGARAEVVGA